METNIYVVKDIKANMYNNPFYERSHVTALRAFTMEVNREHAQNVVFTNPEDFELWHLGKFNTDTGQIEPGEPQMLANARTLKKEIK